MAFLGSQSLCGDLLTVQSHGNRTNMDTFLVGKIFTLLWSSPMINTGSTQLWAVMILAYSQLTILFLTMLKFKWNNHKIVFWKMSELTQKQVAVSKESCNSWSFVLPGLKAAWEIKTIILFSACIAGLWR